MEFTTTLQLHGKNNTGIEVPPEVVDALGSGKKPKVTVTVNGHQWRSSVAVVGGQFLVGVSAENRAAAKVAAGDTITVRLELDTAERVVDVPADLAAALADDKAAAAAWAKLSYSHQRQHVLAIEGAKAAETRARRVAAAIAKLTA